jgi:hypothetical protein
MKKLLILAVCLLLAGPAVAEVGYSAVSVTQTSATTTVGGTWLLLVNDGANEVYFRVFRHGDTANAATTSDAELKADESIKFNVEVGFSAVALVCASGETATVRVFWEQE